MTQKYSRAICVCVGKKNIFLELRSAFGFYPCIRLGMNDLFTDVIKWLKPSCNGVGPH